MIDHASVQIHGPLGMAKVGATRHRAATLSIASDDPLQIFMRPPRNETITEKQARLSQEGIAKKRSDLIDKQLKEELARMKKERANERTILLLGRSRK
jgi:hypothetical protein